MLSGFFPVYMKYQSLPNVVSVVGVWSSKYVLIINRLAEFCKYLCEVNRFIRLDVTKLLWDKFCLIYSVILLLKYLFYAYYFRIFLKWSHKHVQYKCFDIYYNISKQLYIYSYTICIQTYRNIDQTE